MIRKRTETAPCPACGENKPRTREFYYADRRASDGLHSPCKKCHLMRNAAHEKANPRDRTQGRKEWWQKNKDTARLRASPNFARWRNENRAKRMEWEANYRRTETYRKANVAHQNNRRARLVNAEGSHTAAEFNAVLIAQAYRCFYCGIDISNSATEDHFIPLSKGGSNLIENIRASCITCNISKGNRTITSSGQMGGSH